VPSFDPISYALAKKALRRALAAVDTTIIDASLDKIAEGFAVQTNIDYLALLLENVFTPDYGAKILNDPRLPLSKAGDIFDSDYLSEAKAEEIWHHANLTRRLDILKYAAKQAKYLYASEYQVAKVAAITADADIDYPMTCRFWVLMQTRS